MRVPRELTGQLGRYRIVRILGAGGMGTVYLAEDTQLDRQVAFKVPHFDVKTKPAIIERFQREARLAARIVHPNLCAVFEVGEINGVHYFTMPFLQGTPLSELIDEDQPWAPDIAVGLLRKVALAVGQLHESDIVHRDLKPSNIMIRDDGEPVLMDFGLARTFEAGPQRLTASGAVVGSPSYMAPEQINGSSHFGPATDVYGLGVLFYELITGKVPFEAPNLMSLFGMILSAPVPPPSERCVGDSRLDAFCLKALAKSPEDRFPDTASLIAALEEIHPRPRLPVRSVLPAGSDQATLTWPGQVRPTGAPESCDESSRDAHRDESNPAATKRLRWSATVLLLTLFFGGSLSLLLLGRKEQTPTIDGADPTTHTINFEDVKLEMVRIGKGKFWMGSPEHEKGREKDREQQQEVTIEEDFYIGKHEVTQEQWLKIMGDNPSWFSRTGAGQFNVKDIAEEELKLFPVESISWEDIQRFLSKLNELDKDRNSGWKYRLPREAEWEYACRGGTLFSGEGKRTAPFYGVEPSFTLSAKDCNFDGIHPYGDVSKIDRGFQRPCRVGSYPPNPLGLYDMHGNVWEWCDDLFKGGSDRAFRGGSCGSIGQLCRAASRSRFSPEMRYRFIGFRLARVPVGAED